MRAEVGQEIHRLAKEDPRIVFIGVDLGHGAMADFGRDFPDRFFMEGISEQYVVGMSAGLAMQGWRPVVMSIASFITRRSYEQISIDLGVQRLPVVIVGNGAGLSYAHLGPTHVALDDVALMRNVPNLRVLAPTDGDSARRCVRDALQAEEPTYIRLGPIEDVKLNGTLANIARPSCVVLASGAIAPRVREAVRMLQESGMEVCFSALELIHPLDSDFLTSLSADTALVIVEEHSTVGGAGAAVVDSVLSLGRPVNAVLRLGVDTLPEGGTTRGRHLAKHGLEPRAIADSVLAFLMGRAVEPA